MTDVTPPTLIVSGSFAVAAVGKCLRFESFSQSLNKQISSLGHARAFAGVVIVLEACIAVSVWTPVREMGMVTSLIFLHVACFWLVTRPATKHDVALPDCECFGLPGILSSARAFSMPALKPAWWALRNGAIAGIALNVLSPNLAVHRALAIGIATASAVSLLGLTLTVHQSRHVPSASLLASLSVDAS